MQTNRPVVYLALLHYPVYNKEREVVATAVTNLDLHDLARLAVTYGCRGFFVVTPLKLQTRLVERLLDHWRTGRGGEFNPSRKQAFLSTRVVVTLDDAVAAVAGENGRVPRIVATTARTVAGTKSYAELRELMRSESGPWLIVFGTGWGLDDGFLAEVPEVVLEPIPGMDEYNHLSVRSAAAIVLDRLLAPDRERR
ncbi:MAG: hypothetical protein A2V67_16880 [Deltaproteobacteria bacterium RBG_13_61_14]|nr:MAG: hypothetical protein A2V67_16880 [Deltaproteobacteria bacterium RBG_13_61_14]